MKPLKDASEDDNPALGERPTKKLPYFFFTACGVKETEKCEYSIQSNSYFILFFLSL